MEERDLCKHCGGSMRLLQKKIMTTKTGHFELGIYACSECHLVDLRSGPEIPMNWNGPK